MQSVGSGARLLRLGRTVHARITVLPGDGVGPEVVAPAVDALKAVAEVRGHKLDMESHLFGGAAIDAVGEPLPASTLAACRSSAAALLGAVGDPKYDGKPVRPEVGLLAIRRELDLFANLRPVKLLSPSVSSRASPLRPEKLKGVDFLFVRELTGGIYFGERKEGDEDGYAWDKMEYTEKEVERIVRMAAQISMTRSKVLTSVDKNNVLATSRLWRRTAERVIREEFPEVKLNHMLVDAAAMHMLRAPADLDVVVTENMFGDILTDEASMLPGSLGLLPSASLNESGFGLYEPIHGSAPDIAGKGIANPMGTILSAAMLLRHSLKLHEEADAVENACKHVLESGLHTPDICAPGERAATTSEVGDAVVKHILANLPPFPPMTLYDKIYDAHTVSELENGTSLMYVDRHLVHEVTSPQAFEGLRTLQRNVRRPDCTLVTVDHNIPTSSRKSFKDMKSFIEETDSRTQCVTLEDNVREFGLTYFGLDDVRQGIVHVIGPEQGFTLPGTTVVCGDSHTATHGAFGALAFGIGTSEVEHVLATQTLLQSKTKNMRVKVDGKLPPGVTSKDVVLHIIGKIGTAGGTNHTIEFAGSTIEGLSMEARMSICNMAIEAGARAGLIAPDDVTFDYLKDRPMAPSGTQWEKAVEYWRTLRSDPDAKFDKEVNIAAADITPSVTWGTSPEDAIRITDCVPDPKSADSKAREASIKRALEYMGLTPGQRMTDIPIDKVFIGSCTNSRIEDLREVAKIAIGRKVADGVEAMIVPGSGLVKKQAEMEGLDKVFIEAGFDWREPGCSMCLGMNPDQLKPQERCASTSNRNFEGRQGYGGRTHLVSPAMAAAAAVTGRLADVREFPQLKDLPLKSLNAQEAKTALKSSGRKGKSIAVEPSLKKVSSSGQKESKTGGMGPFKSVSGVAAPFYRANVDTDMIIPKQFLKTIQRAGLGKHVFHELRYVKDTGAEDNTFVLNNENYRSSSILIAGPNFGCGSSREHAPWALKDFGIQVIIAESFADIFYNNCFKNGMLPIQLDKQSVETLLGDAEKKKNLVVDLENQVIKREDGSTISFDVEPFRKQRLVEGLDDIALTLSRDSDISSYEESRTYAFPWLDAGVRQAEI